MELFQSRYYPNKIAHLELQNVSESLVTKQSLSNCFGSSAKKDFSAESPQSFKVTEKKLLPVH